MSNNTNALYIVGDGNIGIGTVPSTYKLSVAGTVNATSWYQNGTLLDLGASPLLTGVTAGTVSASKAVVVDANKDISAFRNSTAVNVTGTIQTSAQPNITSIGA